MVKISDDRIEAERLDDLAAWRAQSDRPEERDFEPGSFGCHEALHTASLLMAAVAENLLGHPAIMRDRAWYRHAYKAHEELFSLYQQIGAEHLSVAPAAKGQHARPQKAPKR